MIIIYPSTLYLLVMQEVLSYFVKNLMRTNKFEKSGAYNGVVVAHMC